MFGAVTACGPDEVSPVRPSSTPSPALSTPPSPTAAADGSMLSPRGGDFYAVPDPLDPGDPGDLIRAERVAAPVGAVAWRVLYHSRSVQGADIAVSGLVVAPEDEAPAGGFPLLAYAHGTTGLGDTCALSRQTEPLDDDGRRGTLPLPPLWELGFVVAATDYEGLGTPGRHPYLVGESEARGVLDIARAARSMGGFRVGPQTVVLGVSQGGHAALFTGEVTPRYAPDVDLVGVVALAPAAELGQAALLLTGDEAVTGFAVAIGAGFAAAHPDADVEQVLTPQARALLDVVDTGCIDDVLAAYAGPIGDVVRTEALVESPWSDLLEANSPGRAPTDAPIFVGQGDADALVVPVLTDLLVARLCALGDDVTYRRYVGASHDSVVDAAREDVFAWIGDRLAGRPTPATTGCPG